MVFSSRYREFQFSIGERNLSRTTKVQSGVKSRGQLLSSARNEYKEGARAFQRNLANSISHFPWRHGMKFLLSPRKSRIPIFYAPFFETCVCASGRKRFLGLCNWVVACPDPDECRVTSAPLIFPSSSFVKVSINKRTQSFHHPHC